MTGEAYQKELLDVIFTIDIVEFQEFREKTFVDEKSAKKFLINYLVTECNFGVIYSNQELLSCKTKIKQLLRQGNGIIASKDLPAHPNKTIKDDVYYVLEGTKCFIRDA